MGNHIFISVLYMDNPISISIWIKPIIVIIFHQPQYGSIQSYLFRFESSPVTWPDPNDLCPIETMSELSGMKFVH
jgi:hypothetical protein